MKNLLPQQFGIQLTNKCGSKFFIFHFSLTLRKFAEVNLVHVAFLDEGVVEGVSGSKVVP